MPAVRNHAGETPALLDRDPSQVGYGVTNPEPAAVDVPIKFAPPCATGDVRPDKRDKPATTVEPESPETAAQPQQAPVRIHRQSRFRPNRSPAKPRASV